ncbi:hypothetical protein NL676_012861 [Syzygium grande]|nr:hypothetical protein NL676_012861 [Syzygium grande]
MPLQKAVGRRALWKFCPLKAVTTGRMTRSDSAFAPFRFTVEPRRVFKPTETLHFGFHSVRSSQTAPIRSRRTPRVPSKNPTRGPAGDWSSCAPPLPSGNVRQILPRRPPTRVRTRVLRRGIKSAALQAAPYGSGIGLASSGTRDAAGVSFWSRHDPRSSDSAAAARPPAIPRLLRRRRRAAVPPRPRSGTAPAPTLLLALLPGPVS